MWNKSSISGRFQSSYWSIVAAHFCKLNCTAERSLMTSGRSMRILIFIHLCISMHNIPVGHSKQALSQISTLRNWTNTGNKGRTKSGKNSLQSCDGKGQHCRLTVRWFSLMEKESGKWIILHLFCRVGSGKFKSGLDTKWSPEDLRCSCTPESQPCFRRQFSHWGVLTLIRDVRLYEGSLEVHARVKKREILGENTQKLAGGGYLACCMPLSWPADVSKQNLHLLENRKV